MNGTIARCRRCGVTAASIDLRHDGEHILHVCFGCADALMRILARENILAGGTFDETVDGYVRFRAQSGRPITRDEGIAAISKPRERGVG